MNSHHRTIMIPLFTSIPPALKRITPGGEDIGESYLKECVTSWITNGFTPVSVNSSIEKPSPAALAMGVSFQFFPDDATQLVGKPLIWISDLINFAATNYHGPVVVTNSDILIDLSDRARHAIANLKPGQCVIEKRVDVASPTLRTGATYHLGFDFFVFHTEDLKKYHSPGLVFGQPWWDHHLAAFMLMLGLERVHISDMSIRHLLHTDRWDNKNWVTLGKQCLQQLDNAQIINDLKNEHLSRYLNLFRIEYTKSKWLATAKSALGLTNLQNPDILRLKALSSTNIRWIKLQPHQEINPKLFGTDSN